MLDIHSLVVELGKNSFRSCETFESVWTQVKSIYNNDVQNLNRVCQHQINTLLYI